MSSMFQLIEEDVIGECTRAPEVMPEGIQPPDLAILCLIYSISPEVKEIARQIWELSFPSPLSRAHKM
jgi:hypothetical protein